MTREAPTTGRAPARHCAEVLGRAARSGAPATRFGEAGADLARTLALPLGGLLGGARLKLACSADAPIAPEAHYARFGAIAAHSVLSFSVPVAEVLVSIPLRDLLAVTDRVFGGEGEAPADLPAELPLTADLVAAQIEGLIADAFAAALAPLARPEIAARGAELARLDPFAGARECRSFALTVSEPGKDNWTIELAMSCEAFALLFAARPRPIAAKSQRDPRVQPFAELPLDFSAVVAEFALPLSRLSALKPGDTIPLALDREVPLKILETTIAYGSVGAADERAALQLTRVF